MTKWHLQDRILHIGNRPLIMGIVNVTPDSFSDGGLHASTEAAIQHGLALIQDGADLLDIGGESTRPGALPVPVEEEFKRVVPVIEGLAAKTQVPLSVDTSKAPVAEACLASGAHIVNDVTGMLGDRAMAKVIREAKAGVILMHMQGTPQTMQNQPRYDNVVAEIGGFFEERLQAIRSIGIADEQVVLDPGIGFGKTREHNLEILAHLDDFQRFGRPVCLGVSRKGFVGRLLGNRAIEERLAGSLAAVCYALAKNAVQLVRVHDVKETRDAVTLYSTICEVANCH